MYIIFYLHIFAVISILNHATRPQNGEAKMRSNLLWREAGEEPALAEVLTDPLVHLVMRRDGVSRAQLEAVIARAQMALRSRLCRCAA